MKEIKIPFDEKTIESFKDLRMVCITHIEKYGEPGDFFGVAGMWYVFVSVTKQKLHTVPYRYYRENGYDSPDDFIFHWIELYGKFDVFGDVWLHYFTRVSDYESCLVGKYVDKYLEK